MDATVGEAEAIELARELRADRLLIDERNGCKLPVQEGLPVIGLPGVVLLAKRKNFITSARHFLQGLDQEAGTYLAPDVREAELKSLNE